MDNKWLVLCRDTYNSTEEAVEGFASYEEAMAFAEGIAFALRVDRQAIGDITVVEVLDDEETEATIDVETWN